VGLGRGLDGTGAGPALVMLFCGCAPAFPDEPAHPAIADMNRAAAASRVAAAVRTPQRAFTIRP